MSIFSTIGLAWVIFSSLLASIQVLYLAYRGLKTFIYPAFLESKSSRIIPVLWGKAGSRHVIDIRV
jgi:hypothetical protein